MYFQEEFQPLDEDIRISKSLELYAPRAVARQAGWLGRREVTLPPFTPQKSNKLNLSLLGNFFQVILVSAILIQYSILCCKNQ